MSAFPLMDHDLPEPEVPGCLKSTITQHNFRGAHANSMIARAAAVSRNIVAAQRELDSPLPRIEGPLPILSPVERAAGDRRARDWIDPYGLLDVDLVHE